MGLFFNDYESSGAGISKDAPRKKGLVLFFDLLGRKFWSLMWLNLLYILAFIPLLLILPVLKFVSEPAVAAVLTAILSLIFAAVIGPATAGMMKVQRYFFIEKPSFIAHDFFEGFKENFKKASFIGLFDCLILVSAYAALRVYPALAVMYSRIMYVPMVITFSVFLMVLIMNYYIFLMLTATTLSLKQLYKNAFTLAIAAMKQNLLTSGIIIAVIIFMGILLFNFFALFSVLLPVFPAAFLGFVICFNCYPVIQKYVIDPYYTNLGKVNPEYLHGTDELDDVESVFEDMGGKEKPVEKRKKTKAKVIK